MSTSVLPLPKLPDNKRSSHSFKEQRRQTIEARILRKASVSSIDTNVKPSDGRGNWKKVSGITYHRKPTRLTELQKQEEKENAWKKSVQSNSTESTAATVCKTVSTPSLCATAIENNPPLVEITQQISLSQSYLRKKKLTEKQLQEKVNLCKISERVLHPYDRLPKKPVLGTYQGKVVQSKISSFRKLVEDKPIAHQSESLVSKSIAKPHPIRSMAASDGKIVQSKVKAMHAEADAALDQAQHTSGPKYLQNVNNITAKGNNILVNDRLLVGAHAATISHAKPKPSNTFTSNAVRTTISSTTEKPRSTSIVRRGTFSNSADFRNQPKQLANVGKDSLKINPSSRLVNGCADLLNKEKLPSAVTVRRKPLVPSAVKYPCTEQKKSASGIKSSQLLKTASVASRTVFAPKTVSEMQTAVSSRFVLPKETAEERRARLTQWQVSKGKVMKRPPMVKPKVAPLEVQTEVAEPFPECIMESMEKLSIKGADDTCPKCSKPEQIDEKQSGFSSQDLGSLICESEALSEVATNNKQISFEENSFKHEGTESETKEINVLEVHTQDEENLSKKHKYNLREACRKTNFEKDGLEMEKSPQPRTPEKELDGASVIRINVRTTPSLQRVSKNLHNHMGDSAFKELKFLTPVRRSVRIERNSCKLPEMLQDHDPCLVSLGELPELEDEANAYIYRANHALQILDKDVDCMKTS